MLSPESPHKHPRLLGLALLVCCLVPTVWLGVEQTGLRIDTANRALKSRGTPAAVSTARARREFGSDQAVLLGFAASPGLELDASECEQLTGLGLDLASDQGVSRVLPLRLTDPGLAILEVVLVDDVPHRTLTRNAARIVRQAAASKPSTLRLHATGQPLVEASIARAVDRERRMVVPAIAVTLFILLWWIYRSVWIAGIVLAPAGMTIAWVGGLLHLLGYELDPLLVLLDPLVLTVAVAVSIHLVEAYQQHRPSLGAHAAATAARRKLWVPMLLATVTSMVGFLSLLVSPIPAVGNFGAFAALGVALSTCLAIWTVPTWLAAAAPGTTRRHRLRAPVFRYVAWLQARAGRVLLAFGIIAAALIGNSPRVQVDNDPLRILAAADPVRTSTDWLARRLGGVETLGLLIPATSAGAAPELTALLSADLLERSGVVGAAHPPSIAASGDHLVTALLQSSGSAAREALFDSTEAFHRDIGCADVQLVGPSVQVARDSGSLIRGQLSGLLLVVPLLGITVAIGLRSWRLGLLSLLPSAVPCLLLYGGMATLDRPLSVATVMIGAVMMGLIVDDTIHLLHRYQQSVRHGRSPRLAIVDALRTSGRAITLTSIVLFVGLGVGIIGTLSSTVEFSALAASTIVIAWSLETVVLPAILLWRPARSWSSP